MARTNINRKAFTLVELLVVIVIIAMLVALLVPAVMSARARARRASCAHDQGQVGKAIMQYEAANQQLPGYVNQTGPWKSTGISGGVRESHTAKRDLSWVVVTLEYMGHADIWGEWRDGNRTAVTIPEVICPSDSQKSGKAGALSFAVNCGISNYDVSGTALDHDGEEYNDFKSKLYLENSWGLFFCQDASALGSSSVNGGRPVTIALDSIADGASNTIMLSENLDATQWDMGADGSIRQTDVGFVWWSTASGFSWNADVPDMVNVNALHETPPVVARAKARPSSYHPGGVNAIFADGHLEFISDRVDYVIFRDQMISDQKGAADLIP
jgi:prepilin-type N-terminal cleavage/methylation domain-containing protein/prepilin-type processing-associated H-X9-DG protein